jgi:hypothetical protein
MKKKKRKIQAKKRREPNSRLREGISSQIFSEERPEDTGQRKQKFNM